MEIVGLAGKGGRPLALRRPPPLPEHSEFALALPPFPEALHFLGGQRFIRVN